MAKNEEIEAAITEHLKEQLQKDLSPDESTALRVKVATIRELASE
jgi:hypothetical protein